MPDQLNPAIGKSVQTGNISTNYLECGEGVPVILLHGSGIGVSAYANWNKTLPVFGRHFRTLAPDIAGFGYSSPPDDAQYGLAFWINHLVAFMDRLEIGRAHILGNSFGGALALAIAVRHPERVCRLALMGSVGVPFQIPPAFGSGWNEELTADSMRSVVQRFTYDPSLISDEMVHIRLLTASRPEQKQRQLRLFPGAREERVMALVTPDDEIAGLRNQVLIMHGRNDSIVPLDTSMRLSRLIADADLHVFSRCGHWSHLDRADDFNAMTIRFFDQQRKQ
jgi:pimeloyl-ACP methyl ester carboxylesterase